MASRKKAAPEGPLGTFEGYPVSEVGIAFRSAGDGLSEELAANPVKHETGKEYFFVLKCAGGPVDHEPLNSKGKKVKGDELAFGFASYKRIEDMMTLQAIEVQPEQVEQWLEDAAVRATTARLEREAAQRKANGEESLDDELARRRAEGDGSFDPDNLPADD